MDDVWTIERALWLEGPERFRASMAEDCVMVFPDPVGILRNDAFLAGLEGAPRWTALALDEETELRPAPDCTILAYRAEARRAEGPAYRARCTSTYLRIAGAWRIAQHQHTPLPPREGDGSVNE